MISPISIQTFEFNDQGFVIKIKDGKIFITKDDKDEGVYFNCLYNKTEVDSLISTGVDEDHLRNILLSAINNVLKTIVTYNALKYNSLKKEMSINVKNVEHSSDALLEMFQWTNASLIEIDNCFHDVFGWLNTIKECHCADPGGFNETIQEQVDGNMKNILKLQNRYLILRNDCSNLQMNLFNHDRKFLTYPATQTVSTIYSNAFDAFKNVLRGSYIPVNNDENDLQSKVLSALREVSEGAENESLEDDEYPLVDPSQEIDNINIPVIDDPQQREFDENKPVYGTLTIPFDLNVNGLINGGSPSPGPTPTDSEFNHVSGYDYYYVTNNDIEVTDETYHDVSCSQLTVSGFPLTTLTKIKTLTNKTNVLRFVLRKNEILDESGAFIKDFYAYVENKRLYCPVIVVHQPDETDPLQHIIYHEEADVPFIAFDKNVSFNPYTLYLNGELSIMNLLNQNTIESKTPEIKCDIITARNAFKLHESNVPYLYKPSYINETADHYSMTFCIPDDYEIPTNMDITFKEYCFKNTWVLTWDGNKWIGNNIQGRSNDCVAVNAINKYDGGYAVIGFKKNDFNDYICSKWLKQTEFNSILKSSTIKINGTFDNGDDFSVARSTFEPLTKLLEFGGTYSLSGITSDTYNLAKIAIRLRITKHDHTKNQLIEYYISHITSVHMDVIIKDVPNRFKFTLSRNDSLEEYTSDPSGYYLYLKSDKDAIEYLNIHVEDSNIDTSTRDVTLYLDRKSVKPIEEVNWDPKTNPFKFIIDQQFYEITPNPNAATTLYTDFNITSSKIITADNITTMRSDLNMVANTQDVMVYDVDKLTKKVDNMDAELKNVENVVQHIQKEVKKLRIEAGFALAFGIAGTVMGGAALEMETGLIRMGWGKFMNFVNRGYAPLITEAESEVEMAIVDAGENLPPVPFEDYVPPINPFEPFSDGGGALFSVRTETTDYDKLKTWIKSEHVDPKFSPLYASTEDDGRNPENILVSYKVLHSVSMTYRDSLKPLFNAICNKLSDFDNCIVKGVIPELNKRAQYSQFGIYSTEIPTGYIDGLSYTFNQIPISGSLSIDVKIHDGVHQTDYESSYAVKVDGGKVTEFKNYEDSPTYDYISNATLDEKTLTLVSTVSDTHWTFGMLIGCTEPFKCFTYKGIEEIVYKEQLNKIDDRVKALEQKHSLDDTNNFEARITALELKCKNILNEEINMQSEELTLEQRLEILERKLKNVV